MSLRRNPGISDSVDSRNDGVRVCVIGNAAMDLTFQVDHLPAPGETVTALERHEETLLHVGKANATQGVKSALPEDEEPGASMTEDFGGKGANQAVICARAGITTCLFAALGNDPEGDRYAAYLMKEGVETRHLQRSNAATDISMITVDRRGENTIVTRSNAANAYRPDTSAVLAATRVGDWVAMQGNLPKKVTADVLEAMRRAGRRTFLNPGPVLFDCRQMLADVDVLVVNQVEAKLLTTESDPASAATRLHEGGAGEVYVTLGADGVIHCGASGVFLNSAVPAQAVDTVGAGDAFCGVLLAGLANDMPVRRTLWWAQSAAAFTVARRGSQRAFPSSAMLRQLQLRSSSFPQG